MGKDVFVVTNKQNAKRVFVVQSTNPKIGTYVIEIPPTGQEIIDTTKYAIDVEDLHRKLNWAFQLGYIELKIYDKKEYEQLRKQKSKPSKKEVAQLLDAKPAASITNEKKPAQTEQPENKVEPQKSNNNKDEDKETDTEKNESISDLKSILKDVKTQNKKIKKPDKK